jgi:hypothetical protein
MTMRGDERLESNLSTVIATGLSLFPDRSETARRSHCKNCGGLDAQGMWA